MKWEDKHIILDTPPKKCKKITGTRFASILNKNVWSSPFQIWCEVTKTYEPPFEDTIYTIAGKTIEPKQIEYMRKAYYLPDLKSPTDIYGKDFFSKTYGDFYHDEPIFGGMWDSLIYEDGKPSTVLEFKTTKRSEDWQDGHVPEYYALQAALYAYLLKVEDVIMICSFLDETDYDSPEKFQPNTTNTIVRPFKVHELFPNFDDLVNEARKFYEDHILTGISPDYDEKTDAEYLKALRKNNLNPTTDITKLIAEIESLDKEINDVISKVATQSKELEAKKKLLKDYLTTQLRDGDKQASVKSEKFEYVLAKSERAGVDTDKLKKDGLYDLYKKVSVSNTLTVKEIKSND